MAVKQYKWKSDTTYKSDTPLSHGVTPATHTEWQTSDEGTLSGTWEFYYRDANVMTSGTASDANSSRVVVSLTETWTVAIDRRNNMNITVSATINSVRRDDLRGENQNTPGRSINIYESQGGAALLSLTDYQVAVEHQLSGAVELPSFSFTIAPGESIQRSSFYLHNQTIGYTSYDDIWFGVLFLNDLPKETVPHAVLGSGSKWLSHNRDGGDLRLWNGSRWTDNLKNIPGTAELGDPPSVRRSDGKWYNGRTFGKE